MIEREGKKEKGREGEKGGREPLCNGVGITGGYLCKFPFPGSLRGEKLLVLVLEEGVSRKWKTNIWYKN